MPLHPELVRKLDSLYPSIEERGAKIYALLKEYFDKKEIEDYDLDSFAVYWLASRVDSQLVFAKPEIINLTQIINYRHYRVLWEHQQEVMRLKESALTKLKDSGGTLK